MSILNDQAVPAPAGTRTPAHDGVGDAFQRVGSDRFTILTTTPNAEMAAIHDRTPVIMKQQDWPMWLGETDGDHVALLRAAPDGLLRVWPVDRRAGSPRIRTRTSEGPERARARGVNGPPTKAHSASAARGTQAARSRQRDARRHRPQLQRQPDDDLTARVPRAVNRLGASPRARPCLCSSPFPCSGDVRCQ
jgi:hypothetical protein